MVLPSRSRGIGKVNAIDKGITTNHSSGFSWLKNPGTWGAIIVLTGLTVLSITTDINTQRVNAFRADDVSGSAKKYPLLHQDHCQVQAQQLKQGDDQTALQFANRAEVISRKSVDNPLVFQQQCQKTKTPSGLPNPTFTEKGTSLILVLERIDTTLQTLRDEGNHNPAVVTLTLHAAEPGPDQPPLDFQRVRTLVQNITQEGGSVAIMGPTGNLQQQLETHLQGLNVRVFPAANIEQGVNWAFEIGRQRH